MKLEYNKNVDLCISTIKTLGVDAIQKANSGHPGMLLGISDTAFILFHYFLRFNPKDPSWQGRDNFILSSGHVSMLLYSLLHIYGYEISLEDIKQFRQMGAKTAGHPEYDINLGIEMTTGPLGQGFASSVGFALARKILVSKYGKGFENKTYVIMGDGDLMEGVSYEAASLAGHLKLDNLIAIYDRNKITIDGSTDITFTENIKARFESQEWNVLEIKNAIDHSEIIAVLNTAQESKNKPTLIIVHSTIAKGAGTKEGSNSAHGAPLGEEAILALKKNLNWEYDKFTVPENVYKFTKEKNDLMQTIYKEWQTLYGNINIPRLNLIDDAFNNAIKAIEKDFAQQLQVDIDANQKEATRKISGKYMQIVSKQLDYFIGGSADLAGSNLVALKNSSYIDFNNFNAKNINFGIREHAMGSIANALALSGFVPFVSTFLVFSDYLRPAIRLSALMKTKVIYIFTHDSIWVGEDGPTHQPIEHIDSLRLIPNLKVFRPSGHVETAAVWIEALKHSGPSIMVLTRQSLPLIDVKADIRKGAYVLKKEQSKTKLIVLASGSELALSYSVLNNLEKEGEDISSIRLISVPELVSFKNNKDFLNELAPKGIKKLVIEAGTAELWGFLDNVDYLRISSFGASGNGSVVAEHFKLGIESISKKIKSYL